MKRLPSLLTVILYLFVAGIEGLLLNTAVIAYQEMREAGPGASISVYGKFGWGTSLAAYLFVSDVLLATAIAALLLRNWWQNRPVILTLEEGFDRTKKPKGNRRKSRRRRSHH